MQIFICLVTLGALAHAMPTTEKPDSYQNIANDPVDISENLIDGEYAEDIQGLKPPRPDSKDYYEQGADYSKPEGPADAYDEMLPPKEDAKDYFTPEEPAFRESSFTMDADAGSMKLKPDQPKDTELTEDERASMQQIAAALEKIIEKSQTASDDPLKPIVIMASDGKAMEMAGVEETESTTIPNGEPETFTTDDMPADEPRTEDAGLISFLTSIWDVVHDTVTAASRILGTWGRKETEEPALVEPVEPKPKDSAEETSTGHPSEPSSTTVQPSTTTAPSGSSASPIAAFEEPTLRHALPSQEFEGRRDIDSILYGRGVV